MKLSKKTTLLVIMTLVLSSCGLIIGLDKEHNTQTLDVEKEHFSFVFSHSIMGETHPCGCRHFPLGGLPQVAGLFNKLKKDKEILYVDTGDMLFPSTVVPNHIQSSLAFAAKNLAKGLDKIGLKYMLIGDQDLALGWDFVKEVLKEVKFKLLISNLSNEKLIDHKKFVKVNFGKKKIFLIGLVDPEAMMSQYRSDFLSPIESMPTILKELKDQGYDSKDPTHELFVLSHAGMDADEIFAKKYPQVKWIIGSHSQSFTNYPNEVGKTKIVQVLSKNHYIGEVLVGAADKEIKEPFIYHEMREQLKDELKPNPYTAFIDSHKAELEKIRDKEQKAFTINFSQGKKLVTAKSCLECHQDQADHWQNSPHSVSYASLIIAKEPNNTTCIKCHSLGLGDKAGFVNKNDMVIFEKEEGKELDKAHQGKYWAEVTKAFSGVKSVRKLDKKSIKRLSNKWLAIDEKFKVEHNFSNVQCLNCHNQDADHPFTVGEGNETPAQKFQAMKNKCLGCHTPEQSPEWYGKDKRGIQSRIDDTLIKSKFKEFLNHSHTK